MPPNRLLTYLTPRGGAVASNVCRSAAVATAGVTPSEAARNLCNEPHTAARLARKTPPTLFHNLR
jgi:hypothetical protein